jgi:antitoxin (DNA-binding transcriptional repressor) of toxin-antitoxin stability system
MKVDVQYAETHLADLIAAAARGEIVEIETPHASAQVYASPKPDASGSVDDANGEAKPASRAHLMGAWEGLVPVMSDEEWKALDKEIENEMVNGPIFPPEHA